jgi:hypothetical protein
MVSPETSKRKDRCNFLKGLGFLSIFLRLLSWAWAFFVERFPVKTVEKKGFMFELGKGMLEWENGRKKPG